MLNLFRQAVVETIQFNGQLCGGAIEVDVEVADLMLAAEFESGEASGFQSMPQLSFLVGLISAQQASDSFWSSPSP